MAINIGDILYFKTTGEPCVVLGFEPAKSALQTHAMVRRPIVINKTEVQFAEGSFNLFELETEDARRDRETARELAKIENALKAQQAITALRQKYPAEAAALPGNAGLVQ